MLLILVVKQFDTLSAETSKPRALCNRETQNFQEAHANANFWKLGIVKANNIVLILNIFVGKYCRNILKSIF